MERKKEEDAAAADAAAPHYRAQVGTGCSEGGQVGTRSQARCPPPSHRATRRLPWTSCATFGRQPRLRRRAVRSGRNTRFFTRARRTPPWASTTHGTRRRRWSSLQCTSPPASCGRGRAGGWRIRWTCLHPSHPNPRPTPPPPQATATACWMWCVTGPVSPCRPRATPPCCGDAWRACWTARARSMCLGGGWAGLRGA